MSASWLLKLAAATALTSTAMAHMEMTNPPPFRSKSNKNYGSDNYDYSMTSPLNSDGSNFPCKGYHKDGLSNPTATYQAGKEYSMSLTGSATHGGGSCQLSLSYDMGQSFQVIKSMVGGCPLEKEYKFTIPASAPSGNALFAWTWFNKVGNREMYMNCAPVTIQGNGRAKRANFNAPGIFIANMPGHGSCHTAEGDEVVFPEPGQEVTYGGMWSGKQPSASDGKSGSGQCSYPGGGSGLGGSPGGNTGGSPPGGNTGGSPGGNGGSPPGGNQGGSPPPPPGGNQGGNPYGPGAPVPSPTTLMTMPNPGPTAPPSPPSPPSGPSGGNPYGPGAGSPGGSGSDDGSQDGGDQSGGDQSGGDQNGGDQNGGFPGNPYGPGSNGGDQNGGDFGGNFGGDDGSYNPGSDNDGSYNGGDSDGSYLGNSGYGSDDGSYRGNGAYGDDGSYRSSRQW